MKAWLEEVLDDLCARFLANLPHEEASSLTRLGFQLEQAFWFYEDFYRRPTNPTSSGPHPSSTLPKLNFRTFVEHLIKRCPSGHPARSLLCTSHELDRLIDEFYYYKSQVPTCGAIILNPQLNRCIMVRGFGGKSSWGFPKGKIAKEEAPVDCAVREVHEETGFNIRPYLSADEFIQVEVGRRQFARLYLVPGVPETTHFAPLTRREIGDITWHPINDLDSSTGPHRYYNVRPFLPQLRRWIRARQSQSKSIPRPKPSKKLIPPKRLALRINQNLEDKNEKIVKYRCEIMSDLSIRLEAALRPLTTFYFDVRAAYSRD